MNLQLSLKKQWFEMTKAGIKTEDYREINEYWFKRFVNTKKLSTVKNTTLKFFVTMNQFHEDKDFRTIGINAFNTCFKEFNHNIMTLGYPKSTNTERILKLEHKGIYIGYGNPEWGAEPNKLYFVTKHGEIIN